MGLKPLEEMGTSSCYLGRPQPVVFLPESNPKQAQSCASASLIRISMVRDDGEHSFLSRPRNGFQQNHRIKATPKRQCWLTFVEPRKTTSVIIIAAFH